jgi:hypothetical protein
MHLDMVTAGATHLQVFLVSQSIFKCKVSKIPLPNLNSFMYKQLQVWDMLTIASATHGWPIAKQHMLGMKNATI